MATDNLLPERSNISGIVLHVEATDEQAPEALTFHKHLSRTIAIGRKSSQGSSEPDPERALFRCAVVSRKHAKITFTEFGNVYIIDLHSHHGTHILRPGDLVATSLKPEQPAVLADGDRITFGKSVGRDTFLVRPVVVRVELIFGGDAPERACTPPSRSLEADTADDSVSSLSPTPGDKTFARSISGRFGVNSSSPDTSGSGSSSSEDGDSDIQEISPPATPQHSTPALPFFPSFGSPVPSFSRLRLLQQILPPISVELRSESDMRYDSMPKAQLPQEEISLSEVIVESGAFEEDMELASSRASSPKDATNHDDLVFEEPPLIGAWPASPHGLESTSLLPIPIASRWPTSHEVIEISDDDISPEPITHAEFVAEHGEVEMSENIEIEAIDVVQDNEVVDPETPEASPQPEEQLVEVVDDIIVDKVDTTNAVDADNTYDDDINELQAQVTHACVELEMLRSAHDQGEADFSSHVMDTKERLDALDAQMRATQVGLMDRGLELSRVKTRLQGLGDVMSVLQQHNALAEQVEQLVSEVGAAKVMLQETCAMQRETKVQMSEELEAIKALREETAAVIAEVRLASAAASAAQAAADSVTATLKRKRDESEEEDITSLASIAPPRMTKRRRAALVVSAIAHTATVASLGAAAAWSMLAFS